VVETKCDLKWWGKKSAPIITTYIYTLVCVCLCVCVCVCLLLQILYIHIYITQRIYICIYTLLQIPGCEAY